MKLINKGNKMNKLGFDFEPSKSDLNNLDGLVDEIQGDNAPIIVDNAGNKWFSQHRWDEGNCWEFENAGDGQFDSRDWDFEESDSILS
tara:strand:+ start:215 stop:478 length:264 start_codon:yes stop_codon:yes gene_type:complete